MLLHTYKESTSHTLTGEKKSSLNIISEELVFMNMNSVLQKGLVVNIRKENQANWWKQLSTLTRRSFINMWRDLGYYWVRIIVYILLSICVGTIFLDVGKGYTAILAHGACGGFLSGFMTFMSIGGFPSFIEELKVNYSK
jgi:hypothetical protein